MCKNHLNGWLVVDKPAGITSTDVVTHLKRLLRPQKIGHGGTLDPFATGVLPIALGESTKVISFIMDGLKTYEFTLKFGTETTTEDLEGEVTKTSSKRPSLEELQEILPQFKGHLQQIPPAYSALKIQGKRAYELARAGQEVQLSSRNVEIHDLKVLNFEKDDEVHLEVTCGKGTYVRSLGRDLARKLGCCGHLIQLRRTKVGSFDVKNAFSLDSLTELGHKAEMNSAILPLQAVLDDILAVEVSDDEAQRLRQGQSLLRPQLSYPQETPVLIQTRMSQPVAMGQLKEGVVRPCRVFNLS